MVNPSKPNPSKPRPYRKRKRAEQEEETRLRITEAVVELHREVGPANTKVTEVAERAGVSRMTVYNHFPTEADLIAACSAHWSADNPFPDTEAWSEVDPPQERLERALVELYRWYRSTEDMTGKVLRDAPLVEPLEAVLRQGWHPWFERVVEILARGWGVRGHRREELVAAVRLAVAFETWQRLVGAGLPEERVAALMARMVRGAADDRR